MTLSRRALLATSFAAGLTAPLFPGLAHGQDLYGAAAYSAARNGVSLLVMQRGEIVFEDYPNEGGVDRAWELASGTKSFCGVMAAALAHDGLLSLEELCAETLPEWRADPRKSRITLHQLLTLTSGLGGGGIGRPPPYAEALETPAEAEPGALFQYGPAPFQAFGEIVRRKTGEDPLAYMQRRLFDPLGIAPARWRRGQDGNPHMPSGAAFTARAWATFGRFVMAPRAGEPALNQTVYEALWQGTTANPGYGLTWWLLRPGMVRPGAGRRRAGLPTDQALTQTTEDIRMAAGAGNQRLYLAPERDLIIVRQASGVLRALRGQGEDWDDATFLGFFR